MLSKDNIGRQAEFSFEASTDCATVHYSAVVPLDVAQIRQQPQFA